MPQPEEDGVYIRARGVGGPLSCGRTRIWLGGRKRATLRPSGATDTGEARPTPSQSAGLSDSPGEDVVTVDHFPLASSETVDRVLRGTDLPGGMRPVIHG